MDDYNMCAKKWTLVALGVILVSCGSNSSDNAAMEKNATPAVMPDTPSPNDDTTLQPLIHIPTQDDQREVVTLTLKGDAFLTLPLGADYFEEGVMATSSVLGEIADQVIQQGKVDTSRKGDYLIRYGFSESAKVVSTPLQRIVRIVDMEPVRHTLRQPNTTNSPIAYAEHLPANYHNQRDAPLPLIIFHHGSGSNLNESLDRGRRADDAVQDVLCCSLPKLMSAGQLPEDFPFVLLTPQRSSIASENIDEVDAFVDYALAHYNVDANRVYMVGWSQGGLVTYLYAIHHPDKLTAGVSLAGGFFRGRPSNLCDSAAVPLWSFLGQQDSLTANGLSSAEALNQCERPNPVLVSVYEEGDHFNTSELPFQDAGLSNVSSQYDPYDVSILDWLLTLSR